LELIVIAASPPIRSATAMGIGAMTYAGRMSINLHYDSNVLTRSDAQALLDAIIDTIG
jgi:hypothetical protein